MIGKQLSSYTPFLIYEQTLFVARAYSVPRALLGCSKLAFLTFPLRVVSPPHGEVAHLDFFRDKVE